MGMEKKLGIMGGTFDPIHYGHLVTAETALHAFSLEKVLFIPTGISPHKQGEKITPAEIRCEMIEKAIEDNDAFILSRIEIEREGPSYTVDTLKKLKEIYPDYELYFITGADAFSQIFTWKDPEEILKLAHLIGASRPGFNTYDFFKNAPDEIKNKIYLMEVPALAISSTDIRKRVAKGQSIRYLLPEKTRQIIIEKRLYLE